MNLPLHMHKFVEMKLGCLRYIGEIDGSYTYWNSGYWTLSCGQYSLQADFGSSCICASKGQHKRPFCNLADVICSDSIHLNLINAL